ncbi:MAG: hypothetical protein NTZ70_01125 [Methylococcales bacterium]|nr:hypothetical protein [Methylococcales bacterium]
MMRLWLMILMPCDCYVGWNGKDILQRNKTTIFDSGIEKLDDKMNGN